MISHKHKFLFSHINKCGGTTIDTVLAKYCDKFKKEHIGIPINKLYGHLNQTKHQNMRQMINDQTKNYFKFSFVRNPWDRLVSRYFYRRNLGGCKSLDIKQFIRRIRKWECDYISNDNTGALQYNWLCDLRGNIVTDFIGKIENFQEDFNIICDKIGIPRQELPHKNKTKHKHYTEYYDDELREIVAKKYAKDIEHFGYKFGE